MFFNLLQLSTFHFHYLLRITSLNSAQLIMKILPVKPVHLEDISVNKQWWVQLTDQIFFKSTKKFLGENLKKMCSGLAPPLEVGTLILYC